MAKRKPRLNWGPKGAWVLPKALMEQPDFRQLTPAAIKVLMLLGSQYNGRNNGDLAATVTMLKQWGGMAKGTLAKALRDLLERRIIYKTRYHRKTVDGAKPSLQAKQDQHRYSAYQPAGKKKEKLNSVLSEA